MFTWSGNLVKVMIAADATPLNLYNFANARRVDFNDGQIYTCFIYFPTAVFLHVEGIALRL